MWQDRRTELSEHSLSVAIGASVGLAAGLLWSARRWRGGRVGRLRELAARAGIRGVAGQVEETLESDPLLRKRSIEVEALGDGIIELTGSVYDDDEAHRAIALAQQVPGVRTVLNRLDHEMLESHLADTRRARAAGRADLEETRWYGQGVGMGMRRQGHETDPDRPDDRVPMVSDELGTDRAIEQTSEPIDKLAPGVAGHTSASAAPSDRGTVDDASHRRLGNVPEEPIQDLNPASGIHENVKTGTELTLEESGLEEELEERGLEGRS